MGDTLFGRRCKLTIAAPVSTPGNFSGTTSDVILVNGGEEDPAAPGLQIRFRVKKTREKDPNPAEITVTNLSPSRRQSLQGKGVKVLLEAGYAGTGINRLFSGDARTIDHVRQGADWLSVIKCGDGERAFRYARASESFAPGVKASDVLRYLGKQMGLDQGNVAEQAAKIGVRFDQGYVVWGSAQQQLARLLDSIRWSFSIQDGVLQVLREDESLSGTAIPEISPETGLIGSPEMGSPEKKGGPALCKFTCLLQPARPGALLRLRSERYSGLLTVKTCEYQGDTHGGEWYSRVEGSLHV